MLYCGHMVELSKSPTTQSTVKFSDEQKRLFWELVDYKRDSVRGWLRMLWCQITGAA